jgi:hypothetical protein
MYGGPATAHGYRCWSSRYSATRVRAAAAPPTRRGQTDHRSPVENAARAGNATDGNTGTRWSSAFSDPQWLQVDLGSSQTVCRVLINGGRVRPVVPDTGLARRRDVTRCSDDHRRWR